MAILRAENILTESAPKTFLSGAVNAGTAVFPVKNISQLSASWAVQFGETGEEQSEVKILSSSSPSGTLGTLTASLSFPHPADTPIYAIKYDQIVFEKSTAGTAGTATPITSGTVTIQADSNYTIFDDSTGVSTDAYKTYFRSSGLTVNSTESDWITTSDYKFYSLAKLRERIRAKLWKSDFVDDDMLTDWINEWKDEMTNSVIKINQNYALGTVDVAFGTSGLGTISTADFKQAKRLDITYNGVDYFLSTKMDSNVTLPDQTFSSSHPYHNWEGDSVFKVYPAGPGTARFSFYRFGTTMVNDTDELPVPFRSYTKSFVDYGKAQALAKDGKETESVVYQQSANLAKADFTAEMSPRDVSGPTYINVVESLGGEDNWIP